ncbi:MAG: ABC transporter ATP-binding protein [Candidatus Aenigmarchaeota archaeon]|nr:ABC transporter ATP-binding protein [Candidatus Aenigmarchaeota archaeon]
MTRQIEVRNLEVGFDSRSVISSVNFHANQGEFVSIVGKSGSGKTTFLNALAGFISHKGEVNVSKNIGFVFQDYSLFPWLTVKDNIGFGIHHKNLAQRNEIISHYLKLIELESHSGNYPAELSGGQRQRVAIARAFAPNPDTVLMDEPFGSLDIYTRDRMQKWLLDLRGKEQKTIIFVTHYIDEALFLSDRIYVMKDGKFIAEFTVPFSQPRNDTIKFGNRFNRLKRQILKAMN